MKSTTTAVLAAINAARAAPDAPLAFAECFTFTLSTGTVLTWTNVDLPVNYNGATFSATGPLVSGLKYKASVGLEVDKQQITIAARPTDLISGSPVLNAIREGAFDGATVQRDRVFLSAHRRGGDRRRHAVSRPGLDGRQRRPHPGADHGRERSRRARLRHAAQPLLADLRAHAVRFRLRRDPRNLRRQRRGRRRFDREPHQQRRRAPPATRRARSCSRAAINANVRATVKSVSPARR